jgi:hypothetical protein
MPLEKKVPGNGRSQMGFSGSIFAKEIEPGMFLHDIDPVIAWQIPSFASLCFLVA